MVIRHIVFDAPPDTRGALEVGYSIDESYCRHGYALEEQALFGWANRQHGICQFIASVAPNTIASPGVVRKLGFQHTGSQWVKRTTKSSSLSCSAHALNELQHAEQPDELKRHHDAHHRHCHVRRIRPRDRLNADADSVLHIVCIPSARRASQGTSRLAQSVRKSR